MNVEHPQELWKYTYLTEDKQKRCWPLSFVKKAHTNCQPEYCNGSNSDSNCFCFIEMMIEGVHVSAFNQNIGSGSQHNTLKKNIKQR